MKYIYKIALLFSFILIRFNLFSQGCSTCRAQIINSNSEDLTVGNGLNTGILFLMIIPYIILFFHIDYRAYLLLIFLYVLLLKNYFYIGGHI